MKKILGILLFITMSFACTAKNPATKYQISKEMERNGKYFTALFDVYETLYEYDSKDRLIRRYYYDGNEDQWEFDKNGNLIEEIKDGKKISYKYKNNMLIEKNDEYGVHYYNYDENGNCISEKTGSVEKICKYNKDNQLIYEKTPYTETYFEYNLTENDVPKEPYDKNNYNYKGNYYAFDSKNRLIYKFVEPNEYWWKYDENGNLVQEMDFGEYGPWKVMSVKFTYNSNNQLIYKEDTWKNKIWFEYDKDGNLSKEYGFDGASYWDEGDSEQYEVVKNYDKHGNVIYEKGNDCEYWCEYEYNSNGKIMKEYLYELCN